jgi:hypothetical protein
MSDVLQDHFGKDQTRKVPFSSENALGPCASALLFFLTLLFLFFILISSKSNVLSKREG